MPYRLQPASVGVSLTRIVRDLPAGAFTFVMATGIVSIAAFEFAPAWLSQALLVVACTATGALAPSSSLGASAFASASPRQ